MLAPLAANMSPYRFPPCATSVSTLRNDRRAPLQGSGNGVSRATPVREIRNKTPNLFGCHAIEKLPLVAALSPILRPPYSGSAPLSGSDSASMRRADAPQRAVPPDAMLLGLHPGERDPSTRREDDFRYFRYLFGSSSGSSFDSPFGSSSDSPSAPPSPPPVNRK